MLGVHAHANTMDNGESYSRKEFYCSCCDLDLQSKNVYTTHVNGRKHKKNEKASKASHEADCSIAVSFPQGAGVTQRHLKAYFIGYGRIINVKLSPGLGIVIFDNRESAKRALKKPNHQVNNVNLDVGELLYKDVQQEVEKSEKKTEDEHSAITDMLNHMEDVSQQFSFMTEYLLLSKQDLFTRKKICEELSLIFFPYFEFVTVQQFGSSINGYGMKGCDLDLFLDFKSDVADITYCHLQKRTTYPIPFKTKGLKSLLTKEMPLSPKDVGAMDDLDKVKFVCQILRRYSESFKQVCVVPSKRCPLVKFVHHSSGLKCDLSLNNRKALYNSRLLRLYGQDPRVQQLVVAIRYWAKIQQLTTPGGTTVFFTSYALTWLVLYFLIHRKPKVIPFVNDLPSVLKDEGVYEETIDAHKCLHIPSHTTLVQSQNEESTEQLLHGFFQFYASSIDWANQALSTWDGQMLPRSSLKENPLYADCKIGFMTMLDPFVLSHNILGNVNDRAMARFKSEVKKGLEVTKKWSDANTSSQCEPGQNSKPWGLAELFIPSPSEPEVPKKGNKKNKQHRGPKDGTFTISLHPPTQLLTSHEFVHRAEEMEMTPNAFWCSLVKKMIVNVLETVYLIDVQETSVEEMSVQEGETIKTGQKDTPADVEHMDVEETVETEGVVDNNEDDEIIVGEDVGGMSGDEGFEEILEDIDEIIENEDDEDEYDDDGVTKNENDNGVNVNEDDVEENKQNVEEDSEGTSEEIEDIVEDEDVEKEAEDQKLCFIPNNADIVEDEDVGKQIEDEKLCFIPNNLNIAEDENARKQIEDEKPCFVSNDVESKSDIVDEMMETEKSLCKEDIIHDDGSENLAHYKSDACKRSVQKSGEMASKKLKRDLGANVVEMECLQNEREQAAPDELSMMSPNDFGIPIVHNETKDRPSINNIVSGSDDNTGIQRLDAGEGFKEERKLTPLPLSLHPPNTSTDGKKVKPDSEQIINDTSKKAVGDAPKISKISSYSCCSNRALWLFRAQMKASVQGSKSTLTGLKLEQFVSKVILKRLNKKSSANPSSENSNVNSTNAPSTSDSSTNASSITSSSVPSCTIESGATCSASTFDKKSGSKTGETVTKTQDRLIAESAVCGKSVKIDTSVSTMESLKDTDIVGHTSKKSRHAKEHKKSSPPIQVEEKPTLPTIGKKKQPTAEKEKGKASPSSAKAKEKTQPPPGTSAKGKSLPSKTKNANGKSPTIPPAKEKGTSQPSAKEKSKSQSSAKGKENPQPSAKGKGNPQPSAKGKENPQPSVKGKGNPQPSAKGKGNLQPSAKVKGKPQPAADAIGKSPTQNVKQKHSATSCDNRKVPFVCKIIESYGEDTKSLPRVSIVMHTERKHASNFRNIYYSASNVIVQLVASHLMDVDA